METVLMIIFGILIGGFSLLGGILNWDWFYKARKSAMLVKVFGRTGARIFYSVLGAFIIVCSLICAFTV